MTEFKSSLNTSSADFIANSENMQSLIDDLRTHVARVKLGGGERSQKRHVDRGKLLPHDRISGLLDPGSPFLEFSQLAAHDMYENEAKSLIEKKISLPAYDQCLKASHLFNILDARGVISVAQRAEYISRIRDLVKGVGQVWLESQK